MDGGPTCEHKSLATHRTLKTFINWLVVEPYPSEKWWSEFVSWDYDIPNRWKNNPNVPNHQRENFDVEIHERSIMTTGAPSEINYSNGSNRGTASTCRRYPLLIRWNCKNNLYKWWNLSLPCGFRTQKWKFVFSELQFSWGKKLNSREIGGFPKFSEKPCLSERHTCGCLRNLEPENPKVHELVTSPLACCCSPIVYVTGLWLASLK